MRPRVPTFTSSLGVRRPFRQVPVGSFARGGAEPDWSEVAHRALALRPDEVPARSSGSRSNGLPGMPGLALDADSCGSWLNVEDRT